MLEHVPKSDINPDFKKLLKHQVLGEINKHTNSISDASSDWIDHNDNYWNNLKWYYGIFG